MELLPHNNRNVDADNNVNYDGDRYNDDDGDLYALVMLLCH